jgi:hypothetical protein
MPRACGGIVVGTNSLRYCAGYRGQLNVLSQNEILENHFKCIDRLLEVICCSCVHLPTARDALPPTLRLSSAPRSHVVTMQNGEIESNRRPHSSATYSNVSHKGALRAIGLER